MKQLGTILSFAALLAFSAPASAALETNAENRESDSIWIGSRGRFSNWRAVDRDELIIWASHSKPYLVKIWRPSVSLRFAQTIGVTTTGGRVTKFEKVIVGGQRLPIKSIVALDQETAKGLRWGYKTAGDKGAPK